QRGIGSAGSRRILDESRLSSAGRSFTRSPLLFCAIQGRARSVLLVPTLPPYFDRWVWPRALRAAGGGDLYGVGEPTACRCQPFRLFEPPGGGRPILSRLGALRA